MGALVTGIFSTRLLTVERKTGFKKSTPAVAWRLRRGFLIQSSEFFTVAVCEGRKAPHKRELMAFGQSRTLEVRDSARIVQTP